jgi:hypothetical protein
LDDGTVVVADVHGGSVLFLDSLGTVVHTVGANATGEGGFKHIAWMAKCARDTVFVWDLMASQIAVLSAEGRLVRTYAVPEKPNLEAAPSAIACSGSGVFVTQSQSRESPNPERDQIGFRASGEVTVSTNDGRNVRSLGTFPTSETVVLGGGAGPRPLGKSTSVATNGSRVFIGTADSALIRTFSLDGRELNPIRLPVDARIPSAHNYEEAIDDFVSSIRGPAAGAVKAAMLSLPIPSALPPYYALLVDAKNALWVVRSAPGDSDTRLSVFSSAGEPVGEARIPEPITITEIGSNYVIGVRHIKDGTSEIVTFRLNRSSLQTGGGRVESRQPDARDRY